MGTAQRDNINFRRVYMAAIFIFLVDAYLMNQGVLAVITIFLAGFIFLPVSIYRQIKYAGYSRYIKKYLIYVLSGLLVFLANYANNKLAIYRADVLVHNLELYKHDNQVYPKALEQLVPKYYSKVPSAKVTLMGDFVYYLRENGNPELLYVIFPPFYRNRYDFDKRVWESFD